MYDIRQFRPALYALTMLGVTGFALAAEAWGLWLAVATLVAAHAWLWRRGTVVRLPRWAANVLTLAGFLFMLSGLRGEGAILAIGQFLMLLQVVKLWENRGSRDEAQLIVLSLLLMVAAAITTPSLLFAAMLVVYLSVGLYCSLLFHLKVEADAARRSMNLGGAKGRGRSDDGGHPLTLRQDQRYLPSSMRKLTAVVTLACITCAVLVFVAFPRDAGAGFLGQGRPFTPGQTLTGLGDEVSFQDVARIQQNTAVAGRLRLERESPGGREPVVDGRPLYLRGNVLEQYVNDPDDPSRWQWKRLARPTPPRRLERGELYELVPILGRPGSEVLWQDVTLEPTGTRTLVSLAGVEAIVSQGRLGVRFDPNDQIIKAGEPVKRRLSYRVRSDGTLPALGSTNDLALAKRQFDGRIRAYALRPDVSGPPQPDADPSAPSLGAQRLTLPATRARPMDLQVARNIERHLRTEFSYTLDLTDAADLIGGGDPLEVFLYDLQRGHCEYFAGAMAVLCQSLGIDARVVVGFYCDEFNPQTGAYVLRQSQAHAWVEVLTTDGWVRFDPTSSREAEAGEIPRMPWYKRLLDWAQFTYEENVVSYDGEARDAALANVTGSIDEAVGDVGDALRGEADTTVGGTLGRLLDRVLGEGRYPTAERAITLAIALGLLLGTLAVGWFALERWRLRKRADRLGLDALPPGQRRRLARQLRFYDEMLRTLARHGIRRRPSQTPREFAASLSDLPPSAYATVAGLTRLFYRVRYGRRRLSRRRQRWLQTELDRLGPRLSAG